MIFVDLAFPAHVAAYSGDIEHLRMLIDNGIVNLNERDDKGSTLAHKGYRNSCNCNEFYLPTSNIDSLLFDFEIR